MSTKHRTTPDSFSGIDSARAFVSVITLFITFSCLAVVKQTVSLENGAADDKFGLCLAISGKHLIVAKPETFQYAGATYIYTASETGWSNATLLSKPLGLNQNWGSSVDVSGDRAVTCSPGEFSALFPDVSRQAAAYNLSQGTWGWTATISEGQLNKKRFRGVSIDGNRFAVGTINVAGDDECQVKVCTTAGDLETTLTPSDPILDKRVNQNADNTVIDLSNVFTDTDDDVSAIVKSVLSNSNQDLVSSRA